MASNYDTTTKFKVDISELKSAMQEAKRSVAVANSEFKAVSSSMDDWTKSSDGLKAKLKQLDTTLNSQKTILNNLEAQYEEVVRTQGEGSKAADDLKIKINNQKAAINKTEREMSKYNDTLDELEKGSKDATKNNKNVADSLDKVAKEAKDAGEGFTVFKGAVANLAGNLMTGLVSALGDAISSVVGLADETREYRKEMGKLETAFSSAGHSTEAATQTYKDLYAVLGDEGQAVEAANMLAKLTTSEKELAEWTTIATGVYGTFGSSLPIESLTEAANETAKTGALTGALADALNWAGVNEDDFQAKLDACTTEQERNALITSTLNGLYSEAAETYKEVNGNIMDAQRAQSELADATAELGAVAEPLMTTFKLMGAEFLKSLLPSVQLLAQGFSDLVNGVDGAEVSISEGLTGIMRTISGKITEILPIVANIVMSLINSLVTILPELTRRLSSTFLDIMQVLIQGLIAIAPDLVLVAIQVISTLIDALIQLAPMLLQGGIELFTGLVNALPEITEALLTALDELLVSFIYGLLDAIPMLLESAITLFEALVDAIPEVISMLLGMLPYILETICDFLIQSVPMLLDAAITLLNAIVNAIPLIITPLISELPLIINSIVNVLIQSLPLILNAAITLLMAIINAIPVIVVELVNNLSLIIDSIINTLLANFPLLVDTAVALLMAIVEAIPQIVKALVKALPQIINTIMDKLKELPSKIRTVGSDIVKGLWNGINDMVGWISGKIKSFGESVLGGIKDFFGINSPSKVMAEEVGKWLPEGIAVGIDKNAKSVLNSMRDVTAGVVGATRDGLATTTGGLSGGIINNYNQIINSPKALSRLEIYRQSKNLLAYAGGGM